MGLGILEKLIHETESKVIQNKGFVSPQFITEFIRSLQYYEYDAHVVIMGQNGSGKSMLMLALMKMLDANSIKENKIVYAYDGTRKLISLLKDLKCSCIGIDEGKKFFHYKQSQTTEQIVLTNMIEYARENKNAFIVCSNDVRRLNNNYRNSKVQVVIWLLDRFEKDNKTLDKNIKSYGLVFIGNPALEEEDKFSMNLFSNLYSFEQIRIIAETSPTFYGYLLLEDITNIVSQEELQIYRTEKTKGINETADKFMEKLLKKEQAQEQDTTNNNPLQINLDMVKLFKKKQ